jgi:hypothetical protein
MKLFFNLPTITILYSLLLISRGFAADDLPDWARGLPPEVLQDIRGSMRNEPKDREDVGISEADLRAIQELQLREQQAFAIKKAADEKATLELLKREKEQQAAAEAAAAVRAANEADEKAARRLLEQERQAAAEALAAVRAANEADEKANLRLLEQERQAAAEAAAAVRAANEADEKANLRLLEQERQAAAAKKAHEKDEDAAAAAALAAADAAEVAEMALQDVLSITAAEALAREDLELERKSRKAAHASKDEDVRLGALVLKVKETIQRYVDEHNLNFPADLINLERILKLEDPRAKSFLAGILSMELKITAEKAENIINAIFMLEEDEEEDERKSNR